MVGFYWGFRSWLPQLLEKNCSTADQTWQLLQEWTTLEASWHFIYIYTYIYIYTHTHTEIKFSNTKNKSISTFPSYQAYAANHIRAWFCTSTNKMGGWRSSRSLVNQKIIPADLIRSTEIAKRRIPLQTGLGHFVGVFKGLESISDVPPSQWFFAWIRILEAHIFTGDN